MITYRFKRLGFIYIALCFFLLMACKSKSKKEVSIVDNPQDMQGRAKDLIETFIKETNKNGKLDDTIQMIQPRIAALWYKKNEFSPVWSNQEVWLPSGDSLFHFIETAQLYGLFPEDYHIKELTIIRSRFFNDSTIKNDRKDALLWSKADIMLTDAFVQIIKDVKLGRLPQDSVTLRKDSILSDEFYIQKFTDLLSSGSLAQIILSLEPVHKGYKLLRQGIQKFLDSADYRQFTTVPYPVKDTMQFKKIVQKRLYEGGFIAFDSVTADSSQLASAIKSFQKKKGIA